MKKKTHGEFVAELADRYSDISCICGFVWEATPVGILSGYGCPKCGGLGKQYQHY